MSINLASFIETSAVSALSAEWRIFLFDLLKRIDGRSSMDAISIIIARKNHMPEYPKITEEQRKALIEAFLSILPNTDHKKYLRILYWVGWDDTYKPNLKTT